MKQQKQQKGFSLIELSLVIAVIAVLTVGINLAYNAIKSNLAFNKVVETLQYTFVSAAQSCLNQSGTLAAATCDAPTIVSLSRLKDTAIPFGSAWTVSATTITTAGATDINTLTVAYPLTGYGSATDDSELAGRLQQKLNVLPGIIAAVTTDTLTLNYRP